MTWDTILVTGIYAAPLYVGLYLTWRKSTRVAERVDVGVQKISLEVNGRLSELLEVTRQAARAEGVASEKAHAAFEAATTTHTTLEDVKPALVALAAAVPIVAVLADCTPKIMERLHGPPAPPEASTGEFVGIVLR